MLTPIVGDGWELHVNRLGLHQSGAEIRTYGAYHVYHDGNPVCGLHGYLCEAIGPGDNEAAGCGRRVAAGRYPLWTQFGRYRTIGYSDDQVTPGADPMPAIRLEGTKNRSGILIHPGYPPKLYLSSVGCLNPTSPLSPNEVMNFWEFQVAESSPLSLIYGNLRPKPSIMRSRPRSSILGLSSMANR